MTRIQRINAVVDLISLYAEKIDNKQQFEAIKQGAIQALRATQALSRADILFVEEMLKAQGL